MYYYLSVLVVCCIKSCPPHLSSRPSRHTYTFPRSPSSSPSPTSIVSQQRSAHLHSQPTTHLKDFKATLLHITPSRWHYHHHHHLESDSVLVYVCVCASINRCVCVCVGAVCECVLQRAGRGSTSVSFVSESIPVSM